jgi:hypothetical protein
MKLKSHKRTPEEQAQWDHWRKTGEGEPPGWNTVSPNRGEQKIVVSVKPKKPTEAEPEVKHDFEAAAKVLGPGFTAEDAKMFHKHFTGE